MPPNAAKTLLHCSPNFTLDTPLLTSYPPVRLELHTHTLSYNLALPTHKVNYYRAMADFIPSAALVAADWFHVSAWDYTLYPPGSGGYGAPPSGDGEFDVQSGVDGPSPPADAYASMTYWNARGLPRNRTLMGIPAFGTSYSIYSGGRQSFYSIMARYPGFGWRFAQNTKTRQLTSTAQTQSATSSTAALTKSTKRLSGRCDVQTYHTKLMLESAGFTALRWHLLLRSYGRRAAWPVCNTHTTTTSITRVQIRDFTH